MQVNEFKPKIVAFCCNWCSYAGADLAGSNRLQYPAEVKVIRVPCSCRVNPMFILRALELFPKEPKVFGWVVLFLLYSKVHYYTGPHSHKMNFLFF